MNNIEGSFQSFNSLRDRVEGVLYQTIDQPVLMDPEVKHSIDTIADAAAMAKVQTLGSDLQTRFDIVNGFLARIIKTGPCELSPAEKEVLIRRLKGMSSDEIAKDLIISPRTADSHLYSIFRSLGVHHKNEFLKMAFNANLIPTEELKSSIGYDKINFRNLSKRQLEVLSLHRDGLSSSGITNQLGINRGQLSHYNRVICHKLLVPNITTATVAFLIKQQEEEGVSFETIKPQKSPTTQLSPKQQEIFDLIVTGATNKEIAKVLTLSEPTVGYYLNTMFKKLKIKNGRKDYWPIIIKIDNYLKLPVINISLAFLKAANKTLNYG